MTRSAPGNRFRVRKLSNKQSLAVLRENQIDSVDDDGQRNIPQIETGVERQEETEHHLQAAISAHQAAAVGSKDPKKVLIPTPNTTELSAERYGKLYPKRFQKPWGNIRSSATVEDCCGTQYCMSETDDQYLAKLNESRAPGLPPVTEDQFETIMDLYESAIQQTQPYLSMDVTNIIPFEELEHAFEETLDTALKLVAKHIYTYWREQKVNRSGRTIIPSLKFEQGEKDDGDPYVCFRRREVRLPRKTRRTDASSTDKLKKIRQEFETARGLVRDVLQREIMRRTTFVLEKQIFEQRRTAIDLKRKLNIKDTDEDLINKLGPKRQRTEPQAPPTLRIPIRQDGKPPDADLRQLTTQRAEEEKKRLEKYGSMRKSLRAIVKYNVSDVTLGALYKSPDPTLKPPSSFFCSVQTHYIPSPPHSAESTPISPESDAGSSVGRMVSIIQASPRKPPPRNLPRYRRRVGRGGRILVDRIGCTGIAKENADPLVLDRMKYDNYDSDEDEDVTFTVDPFNDASIKFRAQMMSPPPEPVAQTPNAMRRQMMVSSPLVMAPGAGNPPANGHHPGTPHHPMMTPNGTPTMQVNGMSVPAFPTPRR